ncbi:MAG: 30S ribosomal protein S12 methylthiotransferase RimO [Bacteroidaceae bacterium]|jgi:ribosomal protein S12 methylthiotransferase|nr:30S ribosomal protein S12 methylthiotransferase RimO [Bacteroidaceae bacterium]MBQ5713884.1 30S ribosomal protein S12 methylthiotransferase RimO [Bacteroidaceae bacterium]
MKSRTIDIITLGCSKNLVDSEKLIHQLELGGYSVTHDSDNPEGEIAIVNTCGFIGDAKEESIDTILRFVKRKQEGKLRRLIVMGCLSERYLKELQDELPEVDCFYGKFDWEQIVADLGQTFHAEEMTNRRLTTPSHYAYLKISEGCNRHCAYCAIPLITGKQKSRTIEDILTEVETLVTKGVVEFQIVAQELTAYGTDIYGKQMIAELIDRIAQVPGVAWIRLHYAYPANFPLELLEVMARHNNVCKYLDIALQHISDNQLQAMRRNFTSKQTYELIETIRREVPGIHLRTTFMVGYPGETDEDFQQLLDFVKWAKFERMGAFAYSEEEGTYSAKHLKDDVPDDVKQARLSKLMRLQQQISADVQQGKVGRQLPVVIDREEGEYLVGRTEFDSPEVDPEVLIKKVDALGLCPGMFCKVYVESADDFDLYANVIKVGSCEA